MIVYKLAGMRLAVPALLFASAAHAQSISIQRASASAFRIMD